MSSGAETGKTRWRAGQQRPRRSRPGPDHAVRAHETAVAALDARVRIPVGDQVGDVALLVGRGAARVEASAGSAPTGRSSPRPAHHGGDGADELRRAGRNHRRQLTGGGDPARHLDLAERRQRAVDPGLVPLDYLGAAAAGVVAIAALIFSIAGVPAARRDREDRSAGWCWSARPDRPRGRSGRRRSHTRRSAWRDRALAVSPPAAPGLRA